MENKNFDDSGTAPDEQKVDGENQENKESENQESGDSGESDSSQQ